VRAAFEAAGEPKEILGLDTTNHIDLYNNAIYVIPATDRCGGLFMSHLA